MDPTDSPTDASADALEAALGHRFRDPGLLRTALVHPTYAYENPADAADDNERLEFLGDAVFSLTIAHALQGRPERLSEGEMSRIRAALASERTQAQIAKGIGLGGRILFGRGEAATGGAERPSTLANALEALVGAVFLDAGWEAAERSVLRLYGDRIERTAAERRTLDAKSRLLELAGAASPRRSVAFRIVREEGPAHARLYAAEALVDGTVAGAGSGPTKQAAEQAAALAALPALDPDALAERP